MTLRTLGVIPARGGSKGLPDKNILPLGGEPLVLHTWKAAHAAQRLHRVILSTDSARIADTVRQAGGDVPFLRPAELATDSAQAIPVIQHALAEVERQERQEHEEAPPYDAVVMLQPTTPLRTTEDIDGALALLESSGADSVISVVDVGGHHPARMKYLRGDRLVDPPFCEARENQPRQELEPMYLRNGAIYATRRQVLLGGSFKGSDCRAWIMPAERSVNIDTGLDFRLAELMLNEDAC
ncbi:MAG: acylneuraminate cytidylyltransferase family protein [Acidobacteriota bacterium]|nr:acylneuraminate cytidylyltransferase family protein [Acidobacteriota bacterium]